MVAQESLRETGGGGSLLRVLWGFAQRRRPLTPTLSPVGRGGEIGADNAPPFCEAPSSQPRPLSRRGGRGSG